MHSSGRSLLFSSYMTLNFGRPRRMATTGKIAIEKKKSKSGQRGLKSEFNEYMRNLPIFKQNPNHTWATSYITVKRTAQPSLYLAQDDVAEQITKNIVQHHKLDQNATAIEFNAGFGVLTSRLKNELGFKNINCFEDDSKLGTRLVEKYGINLVPVNYISLPRLHHADKQDGECRISSIFGQLKRGTSPNVYIFGATGTSSLLNFTIRSLVTQRVLFEEDFEWAGIQFFISLGSKPTIIITSSPESLFTLYRPASILFQLLFHHEVLGVLPRKAFLPWESRNAAYEISDPAEKYRRMRIQYDPEQMFLLHFRPNMNIIEKIGKDKLINLWYFIRHNLHSRKNPVIPQLEQWIPGCGPRLILQGFTIYTQFGSLTPSQILDLYAQFISWPEYPSSSFRTAVEKFQSKLESTEEDVLDFPRPG